MQGCIIEIFLKGKEIGIMSAENKIIRKEIHFTGAVQGVGFRYRAKYAAK